jgi:hypothetical protein
LHAPPTAGPENAVPRQCRESARKLGHHDKCALPGYDVRNCAVIKPSRRVRAAWQAQSEANQSMPAFS